jgi:hypothetical protein
MDYRNAYRWYQYDPTKWFIACCEFIGLASHLKTFPSNEIEKGALTMKLKELKEVQDSLKWPIPSEELPILSWEQCELPIALLNEVIHKVYSPGILEITHHYLNIRIYS